SAWSRAKFTALMTSALPAHRAISAGRRSNIPFQTLRAPSYGSSPGRTSCPRNPVANFWIAPSLTSVPVAVMTRRSVMALTSSGVRGREHRDDPRGVGALQSVGGLSLHEMRVERAHVEMIVDDHEAAHVVLR